MKPLAYASLAALIVVSSAGAHTLDEYVQALRVNVSGTQLLIQLDLTPGANIAAEIIRRIDLDGDGTFSPLEAEAYGRAMIADLAAALDDAPLTLTLVGIDMPIAGDMRAGQGVIRVQATAPGSDASGVHRLHVHNGHLPSLSVYLANALLPDARYAGIVRQTRDSRQQTFWLDYEIRGASAEPFGWLVFATAGLATLACLRRRREASRDDGSPGAPAITAWRRAR
jgi:hypothetical protein